LAAIASFPFAESQDRNSNFSPETKRLSPKAVTVKIRFADFETYTRAKSLNRFTDVVPEIRRAAFACLGKFEPKKKVWLIGFRISNLEKVANEVENSGRS